VILLHCLEDRLCVWGPPSITELSYKLVMIEGTLCGVAARNTEIEEDTYQIEQLQITNSEVIPHGVRCEDSRVLSWMSFQTITKVPQLTHGPN